MMKPKTVFWIIAVVLLVFAPQIVMNLLTSTAGVAKTSVCNS